MNAGLFVAALFFTLMDLSVFLFCGIWMLKFICMYTDEEAKRNRPLAAKIAGWAGYGLLGVLLPTLFLNDALTLGALLSYYLLMGWFLYHKSPVGLLYQVMYLLVMYASQACAIMVAYTLYVEFHLQDTVYSYLIAVFKSILQLFTLPLFCRLLKKRYAKDQKNLKIGGMMLIPLFSMVLMFLFMVCGDAFFAAHTFGYVWVIAFSLIILVINGYSLYFWYDVSANQELKNRLELTQRQNDLTYQYYGELEENYAKSRKIIHDIRNHIHMLEQLGKMEEAKGYFTDVHEMLDALGLKVFCENRMLNIVLNDKCRHLLPEEFSCNLTDVGLYFLSDLDVTAIFANLLDNALEAGEGEKDFKLCIQGEEIQDFTVVKISNTFHGVCEKGHSTKPGHEGLGLMNVRQAVEKYHGEMHIAWEEGIFSVTMVFPGQ